jgi:hypothetical protein
MSGATTQQQPTSGNLANSASTLVGGLGGGGKGGATGATQSAPAGTIPGGGWNVNQAAAGGQQAAMAGTAQGMMYGGPSGQEIQSYMNPYQQNVIDNSVNDLDRARQMSINQDGATATSQSAYGGDRHGLVEAETNRNFADATARMSAGLNMAGYQNAQSSAMEAQRMRQAAGNQMGGMAGNAFNMGQTINSNLASAGLQQQSVQQQLIDAVNQQYAAYTNAPTAALNLPLAAMQSTPQVGSTETSKDPGLFNYLSLGASLI